MDPRKPEQRVELEVLCFFYESCRKNWNFHKNVGCTTCTQCNNCSFERNSNFWNFPHFMDYDSGLMEDPPIKYSNGCKIKISNEESEVISTVLITHLFELPKIQ